MKNNNDNSTAIAIIIVCLVFTALMAKCQTVDTVIHQANYTSYYSYQLKEPLYVVYKLYKGGGMCGRINMSFHKEGELQTASASDYAHHGYDEGHLANAKDFAYNCDLEERTFRFYNCLPQTPALNRGAWKHWESVIRLESQHDSLIITCGGIFGNFTIGADSIAVPDFCWKIVSKLHTGEVLHAILCENNDEGSCLDIDYDVLVDLIPDGIKAKKK